MKKIVILGLIFWSTFMFSALAETSIKAQVDKTRLTTDETLTYKIVIASSEKELPMPQSPKFMGFSVVSSAQSSTMSFAESNIKTILVYAYILSPAEIGKFKIEPSAIKIRDKTYSTEAFEIEVTQGKTEPQTKPEQNPSLPEELPSKEPEQPQITL